MKTYTPVEDKGERLTDEEMMRLADEHHARQGTPRVLLVIEVDPLKDMFKLAGWRKI